MDVVPGEQSEGSVFIQLAMPPEGGMSGHGPPTCDEASAIVACA